MDFLNAQQLAFILEIPKEKARAKMCYAWCKEKGIDNTAYKSEKGKIIDPYPQAMPVEILSKHLNLPTLQEMVYDIRHNYLNRPASKKYILIDYPEKFVKKKDDEGKRQPHHIQIPPALRSMLPKQVIEQIHSAWKKRYPVFTR